MKPKVKMELDNITPHLNKQSNELQKLLPKAYEFFRDATPKNTGNARRKTVKVRNEIRANYDYAKPLDQGHSRQAPQGMTEPTIAYLKKLLDKIKRKI